jgi:protein O-GlcNAc transferase
VGRRIILQADRLIDAHDATGVIREALSDGAEVLVVRGSDDDGGAPYEALLRLERAGLRGIEWTEGTPASLIAYVKATPPASPPRLYALHYDETANPVAVAETHRAWGRQCDPPPPRPSRSGSKGRPLKVGFLSQSFRGRHPILFFLVPLLAHLDRRQIEPVLYSTTGQDQLASVVEGLAPVFSVGALSDQAIARVIRTHEVDVLVDLCGHYAGSRLLVFAHRPAPVLLTWLAYPNCSGLSAVDYRLSDDISDPFSRPAALDALDPVLRLNGPFVTYEPPSDAPAVSELPALLNSRVTFAIFNNPAKIAPRALALWARILDRVPGARLLFHHGISTYDDPNGPDRRRIADALAGNGIGAERLSFTGCLSYLASLELYGGADIALDTFPYNGTTTTCESLWMGLPVVHLKGDSHVSRVTTSLLTHAGLPDLIGANAQEYLDIAVHLAQNRNALALLRAGMRQRLRRSRLLDHASFARNFENVVRKSHECNGDKECR